MAGILRCCRSTLKVILVTLSVTIYVFFLGSLWVHLSSEALLKHTPNWRTAKAMSIIRANSIHKFVHFLDISFLMTFFIGNALALLGLITMKPKISIMYWILATYCILIAIPHYSEIEDNPLGQPENLDKNTTLKSQLVQFKLGPPADNETDTQRLESWETWSMLKGTFKCCGFGETPLYNRTCPPEEGCIKMAYNRLKSSNDFYSGVVVFQTVIAFMNVLMCYVAATKEFKPAQFYAWLAETIYLGSGDEDPE